jgi:chromosome partitioning protein
MGKTFVSPAIHNLRRDWFFMHSDDILTKKDDVMIYENVGPTPLHMASLSGFSYDIIQRKIRESNTLPLPNSPKKNRKYPVSVFRDFLKDAFSSKHIIVKKVHSFYNFKGGVGKTSLAFQVSCHLSILGFNVLLIDTDPQANLTNCFGLMPNLSTPTLYDILIKGIPVDSSKVSIFPGLDFIQSNISLTRLETELMHQTRKEEMLKDIIDPLYDKYDFIIIDANPNINQINRNVINASQVINIVCETQPFSIMGLSLLYDDMNKFFVRMKKDLPAINIIPNKYEDRISTSAEAMHTLRTNFSLYMKPDFAVRKSEDFNVSAKSALPLSFFCKKNSNAWEDSVDLIHHIIKISEVSELSEKAA